MRQEINNPFDFFSKIYCINLAERQDRWNNCLSQSEKHSLKLERFEAIKPTYLSSQSENGRLGCAASYCELIKHSIVEENSPILILEDDFIILNGDFTTKSKLLKCITELPDDWDCFYLGANVIELYTNQPISKFSENLFKLNSAYATHSIAFSSRGLLKFSSYFSSWDKMAEELVERYEALDIFFAKEFLPNSNSFICNEILISQADGYSSIEGYNISYTRDFINRLIYFKSLLK
jgi:GR25 family glycosyltransferase involved in LPS biosynthesis